MMGLEDIANEIIGKTLSVHELEKRYFHFEGAYNLLDLSTKDSGAEVGKGNMIIGAIKYSLALEEQFGKGEVTLKLTLTPDHTFTKNDDRFNSRVSYGLQMEIENNTKEPVIFPQFMPNGCSMTLAYLNNDIQNLQQRILEVESNIEKYVIGNEEIGKINLSEIGTRKGNHFIDTLEVTEVSQKFKDKFEKGQRLVLMHTSEAEFKNMLYKYKTSVKGRIGGEHPFELETISTPFGDVDIIAGKDAHRYMRNCEAAGEFSKQKQELMLREIFGVGSNDIISFSTHQNYFWKRNYENKNEIVMRLGALDTSKKVILPVGLTPEHPVYAFEGKQNLTKDRVCEFGILKDAERFGLDRLENVNVMPHGGGHRLRSFNSSDVQLHIGKGGNVRFDIHGQPKYSFSTTSNTHTYYRTDNDIKINPISLTKKLELGNQVLKARVVVVDK